MGKRSRYNPETYYDDVKHRDAPVVRPTEPEDVKAALWHVKRALECAWGIEYHDPKDAESDAGLAVATAVARWSEGFHLTFAKYAKLLAYRFAKVRRWNRMRRGYAEQRRRLMVVVPLAGRRAHQRETFKALQESLIASKLALTSNLGGSR